MEGEPSPPINHKLLLTNHFWFFNLFPVGPGFA
jgi:hypothetical protein